MSGFLPQGGYRGENARTVVVQCPNCQSKFRIADEKVTDRGVRVRCTSCKNVFQVKRSGATQEAKKSEQGVTGQTQEMQALDPGLLGGQAAPGAPARPGLARPVQQSAPPAPANPGQTAIFALPTAAPPAPLRPPGAAAKPAGTPLRPAARPGAPAATAANNGKPRLQADDLFGMAELTGDASATPGSPLSSRPDLPLAKPAPRPPPGKPPGALARPPGKPPPGKKPAVSADAFDAALDAAVGNQPAPDEAPPPPPASRPPPAAARPAARPARPPAPPPPPPPDEVTANAPPPPPEDDAPPPPPPPPQRESQLGGVFEGVDLATSGEVSDSPVQLDVAAKPAPAAAEEPKPAPAAPESIPPRSGRREAVGSALTGLVGAALAIAVVLAGALSEGTGTGWFGFGTGSDVVATRVVSGLYETGAGRLVFFVRGRVVNNGTKPRGPVRVVAELVSDEGTEARSETLAGVEPTPEDVYNLKSTSEAEKLARSLSRNDGERRIPPGGSLPFFTLIPEPPSDLNRHHLQVHLETIDAWTPPAQHADAPKTEAPKAEAPKVETPPPAPPKVEAAPAKPDKKGKKGNK